MDDRQAQVEYYKQAIIIYSTGLFVCLGAVTAAVVRMTDENRAETGIFIAFGIVLCVFCSISWVRDMSRFKRLVKLK